MTAATWSLHGQLLDQSATLRADAKRLRGPSGRAAAALAPTQTKLAEAEACLASIRRELDSGTGRTGVPWRGGRSKLPRLANLKPPEEYQRLAADIADQIAATDSPADKLRLTRQREEVVTWREESTLRNQLAGVDRRARARAQPVLRALVPELEALVPELEAKLDREAGPLRKLQAEIERIEAEADAVDLAARRMESELLGLDFEDDAAAAAV